MKGKRLKAAQKTLFFYKLNFGITPPYRLLIDGTICNTAYSNHINLAEQIPKLFQADVKIYTTQCALSEVEGLQARFGNMIILYINSAISSGFAIHLGCRS